MQRLLLIVMTLLLMAVVLTACSWTVTSNYNQHKNSISYVRIV